MTTNNNNNNNNNNNDFYTESTKWLFACTLKAIKTNILEITNVLTIKFYGNS